MTTACYFMVDDGIVYCMHFVDEATGAAFAEKARALNGSKWLSQTQVAQRKWFRVKLINETKRIHPLTLAHFEQADEKAINQMSVDFSFEHYLCNT